MDLACHTINIELFYGDIGGGRLKSWGCEHCYALGDSLHQGGGGDLGECSLSPPGKFLKKWGPEFEFGGI